MPEAPPATAPRAAPSAIVGRQNGTRTCRSSSKHIVNGLVTGCLYALIALGYSMVYGVLKLLNFAHGDVYMVGAYIGYFVIQWFGGPTALSIPVPLLIVLMLLIAGTRHRFARGGDRAVRLPAAA